MLDIRSLWNFDDPAGSERRFHKELEKARGGKDLDVTCELLAQIGRAQGLQRKFAEAQETLRQTHELLNERTPRGRIRYFLEQGRLENSSGSPEAAGLHFLQAFNLANDAHEEFLAIDAAHMMAIVEKGQSSLEWNERAILMAEQATDPAARNWLGSLYNNTGWTYHDMGNHRRAMDLFERALAFREAQGEVKPTLIARWCVARCKRSLGEVEAALALQREMEAQHALMGEQSGFVHEEIGECLYALGKAEEAKPHFATAYELLTKDVWLSDAEPRRLVRLKELSR